MLEPECQMKAASIQMKEASIQQFADGIFSFLTILAPYTILTE
jgi:hypothetical protein